MSTNGSKLMTHRFIIVALLGGGMLLQSVAERPLRERDAWPQTARSDLLLWYTLVLAVIVLVLLWRGLRLRTELGEARAQLASEHELRLGAERARQQFQRQVCQLGDLAQQAREDERRRIARDIHDDLGQNLLALKIDISMLHLATRSAHPFISQTLGMIEQNVDAGIKSLRCIINDLRPPGLAAGLKAAVECQLLEFSRINAVNYELKTDHNVFEAGVSAEIDCAVYRILQESLSNIARHAHATEVRIALRRQDSALCMTISDNGVGMAGQANSNGCGLIGIGDRVAGVAGRLRIDSAPGRGTTLEVAIPLTSPAMAA